MCLFISYEIFTISGIKCGFVILISKCASKETNKNIYQDVLWNLFIPLLSYERIDFNTICQTCLNLNPYIRTIFNSLCWKRYSLLKVKQNIVEQSQNWNSCAKISKSNFPSFSYLPMLGPQCPIKVKEDVFKMVISSVDWNAVVFHFQPANLETLGEIQWTFIFLESSTVPSNPSRVHDSLALSDSKRQAWSSSWHYTSKLPSPIGS